MEQAEAAACRIKILPCSSLEQVGVAALIFNWSVVKVDVKSQGPGISQVTLAWWLVRSLVKLPPPSWRWRRYHRSLATYPADEGTEAIATSIHLSLAS